LYICLPLVWGAAGGGLLIPHYSWDRYGNQKITGPQDLKKKRSSPSRSSLQEIRGAGSSGASLNGLAAVEISAKGRDKPMARNLPTGKTKNPSLGIQSYCHTTAGSKYF
jgi:hypothetical protein